MALGTSGWWIRQCLISTHIFVLVNGDMTEEFVPQKGLRQGDMLALFLFTIVAESLSEMTIEVVAKKLFDGFPNGKDNIEVNLLQYVDDTLFIRKATNQNVVVIKSMLTCLELISSLKVNFLKSSFGAIGVGRETLKCFAEILHYRLMFFAFMYLGLPVSANPRK